MLHVVTFFITTERHVQNIPLLRCSCQIDREVLVHIMSPRQPRTTTRGQLHSQCGSISFIASQNRVIGSEGQHKCQHKPSLTARKIWCGVTFALFCVGATDPNREAFHDESDEVPHKMNMSCRSGSQIIILKMRIRRGYTVCLHERGNKARFPCPRTTNGTYHTATDIEQHTHGTESARYGRNGHGQQRHQRKHAETRKTRTGAETHAHSNGTQGKQEVGTVGKCGKSGLRDAQKLIS